MRSTKGNSISMNEEEEEYDDDFSAKKDGTSNSKDSKNNDRATAIRSKHSVTEQRRRCKINERFQILRDLIPHGDHKRDTASFLLEVIDYVQVLQEKVQKYEGSYQAWSTEATKLMPWRHSHWRNQGLLVNNGSGPAMPISGKSDEKSVGVNPGMVGNGQTPLQSDANLDAYGALGEPQSDLTEKMHALHSPFQVQMPIPVHTENMFANPSQGLDSHSQSTNFPIMSDSRPDDHAIEGGTINISSSYSQELLSTLTQALQSSGVDLSKARISIQIDIGKRANQALESDIPHVKEYENAYCNLGMAHQRERIGQEELDQAHKRLRS